VTERTVTVDTIDHGRITISEPAWCLGEHPAVRNRAEISHDGRPIVGSVEMDDGTVEFLRAHITHGPFLQERPELRPSVAVDDFPLMDSAQLRELAAEVALHAGRLYTLAGELDELAEGGES
jgi:hypothetical protein